MKKPGENGFTLLEVLIAMTILSIGIMGIAGLAGTAVKSSGYSQALTQATNLAQDRVEALLSVDFLNIQATDNTGRADLQRTCNQIDFTAARPVWSCNPTISTMDVGNTTYTWSYTVTFIDLNGDAFGDQADALKRIDLTVSWTDPLWGTQKSVNVTTLRTRG